MQHVGGVRGVVVRVGGMVAGLDELQPRAQRGLRAVQELAHAEGRKDLEPEVGEGPAEDEAQRCKQTPLVGNDPTGSAK